MRTKEIEKELGLTKHTIRYYEKEGFIFPKRDENGYRDYSEDDIQTLQLVKFLRNLNISTDDVKSIIQGDLDFHECLKVNSMYLNKQLESLSKTKQSIAFYETKELPPIPSLMEDSEIKSSGKLGFQKTTNTVSLGRKLTRPWAIRKWIYTLLPSLPFGILFYVAMDEGSILPSFTNSILSVMIILVIQLCFLGASFQASTLFGGVIDHSMNQSVEFLKDGIRYYGFESYYKNLCYYFSVLLKKDSKWMRFYPYDDIKEIIVHTKHRYMGFRVPIASEMYVADFQLEFSDGNSFYFCWPMILDDDSKLLALILEEKVKNIVDDKKVLYAMKNNINLTTYFSDQ